MDGWIEVIVEVEASLDASDDVDGETIAASQSEGVSQ
jgi:hypothetical protein